nr:microtubule-associated protein futsch-like isoform X1 [Ipomoea batatas]
MAEQVYKNEEKIECGSEFFTPGISLKEDVDSSSTGFAEREFQESGDRKSAKEESLLTGNDWEPHGVNLNSNTEETNPGMPLVEAQSLKDLESIYEQAKLESVETEVAFGLSQSPREVQLLQNSNTEDISPGLPLVEASSVKDLEAIYELAKLSSMETKVGLGPSELNQDSNTEDADAGMPLVEANSLKDLESIYEQAKLDSMETNLVLELPELNQNSNAEDADPGMPLVEASSLRDLESIYEQAKSSPMETEAGPGLSELSQNLNTEDADPGMPMVEASSLSDLESIYEQAKSNSLETEVVPGLSELPQEVRLEADTDSGMPVVVAQSIEDLDSVFRQIDSKEREKHDLLDPSHTDSGMSLPEVQSIQDTGSTFDQIDSKGNEKHDSLHPPHAEEASGESENVTLQEHSSLIGNEIKFEARSTEDTDSDHLQLHESDPERHILRDSLVGDADALELLHVGAPSHECEMETDSALKQETEDNAEKPMKSSSSSQDVLVEATHNVEGDSSKGTSSVKDRDVPEDGNDGTKKLNFEVDDKSEDSDLATSAEKGDQETPEGDSSRAMDVKAKKEESPGDSHKE